MTATAMTVLGPVPASELGVTLLHEHLLADWTAYWEPPKEAGARHVAESRVAIENLGLLRRNAFLIRDNLLLTDARLAEQEVLEFKRLGGTTIVDVTLPEVGRDVERLQAIARATGLNIVAGCGHYVHASHPPGLASESIDEIADRLVNELTEGIADTGVRPGIIGEIGTWDPLHPTEEKVLRAAARAQQATGVAVTVHLHVSARKGHDILGILEEEGADLSRVVLDHVDIAFGHLDTDFGEVVEYHASLARRGCFLEYDTCGVEMYVPGLDGGPSFWLPSDLTRARGVAALVEQGFEKQLILSHDVWLKTNLVAFGGFGYGHILRSFTRNLREVGLSQQVLDQLLIDNPRAVLTTAA
jgi:phosphotriesterase-related protein